MVTKINDVPAIFQIYVPLLDTGFNRPECKSALEHGMQELGIDIENTSLFLTHLHSDHTGLVYELTKNKKCTIMKRKSIGLVKMIERNDLLTFQFYKKEKFTGSFLGMRYLIQREKEGEEEVFAVFVWPGPYNFAATSDNLKTKKTFPFQEESLQNIVCYLNDAYYIVQKHFLN